MAAAATWLTGSYDPETDTLYWATGNPWPDSDDRERGGDNLFTNCVLALDPGTGKMKWYYQFTPHDVHDWDATEPNVLVNTKYRGQDRKLLLHADRNGFFYVFDRTNGKLLLAQKFVRRMTWASGIGPDGRPLLSPGTRRKLPRSRDELEWNSVQPGHTASITSWRSRSARSNSRPAVGRTSVRARSLERSISARSISRPEKSFGRSRRSGRPTAREWQACWQPPAGFCSTETRADTSSQSMSGTGKRYGASR